MAAAAQAPPRVEKRMEARTAGHTKLLLDLELSRSSEETGFDMAMLLGVDGRTFASSIPPTLTPAQYHLLNLVRSTLPSICAQLRRENMHVSIQEYEHGTVVITGVGPSAFLVYLSALEPDLTRTLAAVRTLRRAAAVVDHIFHGRPLTAEALSSVDPDVAAELERLSRLLFLQRYGQTKEYRRNMDVLAYLKGELTKAVGRGAVDEILTVVFNELGTAAAYMTEPLWRQFVQKAAGEHVRRLAGDAPADQCLQAWSAEVDRRLKTFV